MAYNRQELGKLLYQYFVLQVAEHYNAIQMNLYQVHLKIGKGILCRKSSLKKGVVNIFKWQLIRTTFVLLFLKYLWNLRLLIKLSRTLQTSQQESVDKCFLIPTEATTGDVL